MRACLGKEILLKAMDNEKNEIRRLKNGGWYWINKRVLRLSGRGLKASGIVVYNALASYANSKNKACFPTQKTIAELIEQKDSHKENKGAPRAWPAGR